MKPPKVKITVPKKPSTRSFPLPDQPQDWYTVDGVKYLREDLVNQKMEGIMERMAKALETQVEFIKKWDKPMQEMSRMMGSIGKK